MIIPQIILGIISILFLWVISYLLITPIISYILSSVIYLIGKLLKSVFSLEMHVLNNPNNGTVPENYRVYNPNPISYFIPHFKYFYILCTNPVKNGHSHIFRQKSRNMPIHPIVKNTKSGFLYLVHTGIIERLKKHVNQKRT
jgi:hypothetical protein